MTMRPWHWLLAVVALVVPLQAVALDGGSGGGLGASASLGYCGVSETGISCQINVSWSGVEDAERYTASTTLADGSVRDHGTVGGGSGGGSTSVWVPYVGAGTYSVTVTAWGNEDGEGSKLDEGEAKIDDEKLVLPEEAGDGQDESSGDEPEGNPADPPTDGDPAEPEPEPLPEEPVPAPEPLPEPPPEQPEPPPEPLPEADPELPVPGEANDTETTRADR